MNAMTEMSKYRHEKVLFVNNEKAGLKAIIAVHNTNLGPAIGGCRLFPYASYDDALFDVLRLSRGMSHKNAVAGLPHGGGKGVIIADPSQKTEAMFEAFAEAVNDLGGNILHYTSQDGQALYRGDGEIGVIFSGNRPNMNLSGKAVRYWMNELKIQPENLLVISDDLNIPFGTLRLRKNGSAGGHNGLKSIIACCGGDDFPRIKIGIGKKPHPEMDLADWVLGKYQDEEARKIAFDAYMLAAEAALCWAEHGIDLAMNRYNKRNAE